MYEVTYILSGCKYHCTVNGASQWDAARKIASRKSGIQIIQIHRM